MEFSINSAVELSDKGGWIFLRSSALAWNKYKWMIERASNINEWKCAKPKKKKNIEEETKPNIHRVSNSHSSKRIDNSMALNQIWFLQ